MLGISNFSRFTGHALHAKYCTSILNAPHLNIQEKLSATRHSTVNALLPYVAQTMEGETRKLKALGIIPSTSSKTKEVVEKFVSVQPVFKEEVKHDDASKKVEKVTYYIILRK